MTLGFVAVNVGAAVARPVGGWGICAARTTTTEILGSAQNDAGGWLEGWGLEDLAASARARLTSIGLFGGAEVDAERSQFRGQKCSPAAKAGL